MTYMPPQPAKPRNNLRTILIVVGIVLVLCCGGAVAGGVYLFRGVAGTIGPVNEAASAYMDDLVERDYSGAYQRLCAQRQAQLPESTFTSHQKDAFSVRSYNITNTNVSNMNGNVSASVTVRITMTDGADHTQIFRLVKEDGEWKVCG